MIVVKPPDEYFLVIPGLEFNINNEIHILGVGIEKYINESDPEELIRKIHENNGLAILAHTADYKKIPYDKIKRHRSHRNLESAIWRENYRRA